ncbi:class IV adenylate cyclase [Stieleria sp. TO1_6]|uniref:class IV adenylate cyclase n=1 Tax=Stieleria tagensis TaxID=2956795 RepID=UPI00209A659D|nr:class IV adenylate cyclase [Stieleria tagensis]MCO8122700.1 class IV adenylate cyclase [Stieleria tagensis]
MLEVEQKYELDDQPRLRGQLAAIGAIAGTTERHRDTYFQHPSRDFVQTSEALRIREIDSIASVTYKGPKLAVGDSTLKARKEIEWCLAPGDANGCQMHELLVALGFREVATVRKERQSFHWPAGNRELAAFTLTIDLVDQVGLFSEIELLVPEADAADGNVDQAGERIAALAARLSLTRPVRESYLELLLR